MRLLSTDARRPPRRTTGCMPIRGPPDSGFPGLPLWSRWPVAPTPLQELPHCYWPVRPGPPHSIGSKLHYHFTRVLLPDPSLMGSQSHVFPARPPPRLLNATAVGGLEPPLALRLRTPPPSLAKDGCTVVRVIHGLRTETPGVESGAAVGLRRTDLLQFRSFWRPLVPSTKTGADATERTMPRRRPSVPPPEVGRRAKPRRRPRLGWQVATTSMTEGEALVRETAG